MSLARARELVEDAAGHIEAAEKLPPGVRPYSDAVDDAKRALVQALTELNSLGQLEREWVE